MSIENSTSLAIQSIEADGNRGGWQSTASFANDQDEAIYGRRVDIYFTAEGGGEWESDAVLGMRGSIIPQSVRFDIRQSGTELTIATSDTFLQNAGLQGIYNTSVAVVTHPHEYLNMTLGDIVKHIIEQHSNISSTANVQNTDGTFSANPIGGWVDTTGIDTNFSTRIDVFTVRQSNSIWQVLKKIAANEFYVSYMNKSDEFIYEVFPAFATTLPTVTLDIDDDMIVSQPEILFRNDVGVDQVVLAALTDEGDILRSSFPDKITAQGRRMNLQNLRCNDINRLDNLAQRVFSRETREFDIRLQLAGPWGLYLELFDRISLTYTGTARNGVSLSFVDEKFYINKIRVNRSGSFGALTELEIQQENIEGSIYA